MCARVWGMAKCMASSYTPIPHRNTRTGRLKWDGGCMSSVCTFVGTYKPGSLAGPYRVWANHPLTPSIAGSCKDCDLLSLSLPPRATCRGYLGTGGHTTLSARSMMRDRDWRRSLNPAKSRSPCLAGWLPACLQLSPLPHASMGVSIRGSSADLRNPGSGRSSGSARKVHTLSPPPCTKQYTKPPPPARGSGKR